MSDKDIVKNSLETAFDIPFSVEMLYEYKEPVFILAPEDPGKEFFSIKISFRNRIRLTMDFIPQKYSVKFVHSMGKRSEENRQIFSAYCTLMTKRGAKVAVKVNGMDINVSDVSSWPEEWASFEAKVTKMPIVENGIPDYFEITREWGSLMMGMVLALADIIPIGEEEAEGYVEGDVKQQNSVRYERNLLNRKLCLESKGYSCMICGFEFEKVYGKLGHHFIHVHHITPVSKLGSGYIINPMKDLIPVCPNCHAMLHRNDPPLQPEQLKEIYVSSRKNNYCNLSSGMLMVAEPIVQYDNNVENGNK